uniref:very-long-chain (3R)-3-hydroxyacyl-CoA dehydratase n=2 Tax=Spongospora subterranea TaxID=70186 RepID=A0A0H5QP42_9EUKA|eukprot:CRZ03372.1 hypothetical protein [Spongospora subterranea]
MLCVAWSCAEVPRYLYYAVNSFGSVPYPLLWLRYSGFLILYPMGFVAETLCIYNSLGFFFKTQQWSIAMPNVWNFEFSWARLLQLIIALYVPGSPFMFLHMCRQRVKYLSGRTRTPLPSSKMMERKSSFKSKKAD